MQRVKRSTAVAVLPAAPAGGTPGYFAEPSPGGGIPATVPGFEWYNSIQEELCAVVAAGGLTLDIGNTGQVIAALKALFGNGRIGHAFSSSDWCPLAGGIILQWGNGAAIGPLSNATFVLPCSFPNTFFHGIAFYDNGSASQSTFNIGKPNLSTISIYNTHATNTATPSYLAFGW